MTILKGFKISTNEGQIKTSNAFNGLVDKFNYKYLSNGITFEKLCKLVEENKIEDFKGFREHITSTYRLLYCDFAVNSNTGKSPKLVKFKTEISNLGQKEKLQLAQAILKSNNLSYVAWFIKMSWFTEYADEFKDLALKSEDVKLLMHYALNSVNHKLFFDKIVASNNFVGYEFFERYFYRYGSEDRNEKVFEKMIQDYSPKGMKYLLKLVKIKDSGLDTDMLIDLAIKSKNLDVVYDVATSVDSPRNNEMYKMIMLSDNIILISSLLKHIKQDQNKKNLFKNFVLNSKSMKMCDNYLKYAKIQDEDEIEEFKFAIEAYALQTHANDLKNKNLKDTKVKITEEEVIKGN